MFKIFFLSLFLLNTDAFDTTQTAAVCPEMGTPQKTGQGSGTISFAWGSAYTGAQYRLWYTRTSDGYTSSVYHTYNLSHTFSGLSAGHHTFYFQTVCEGESSGYIGIEDVIMTTP